MEIIREDHLVELSVVRQHISGTEGFYFSTYRPVEEKHTQLIMHMLS